MSIVDKLLGGLAGPVVDYFKERRRLKYELKLKKLEGEIRKEEAKAEREIKFLQSDHQWELEQIRNSGWKDEWVLLLLSIPMILSFIPATVVYVQMGFAALMLMPEWYMWLTIMIFAATYGIRVWRRRD